MWARYGLELNSIITDMATLKFLLQSISDPSPIYVRLRDGKEVDLKSKTGLIINPSLWSAVKQKPKNAKSPELKKLSNDLENLKVQILNAYNDAQYDKKPIDQKWLKLAISGKEEDDKSTELVSYFTKYIAIKSTEISKRGVQKIQVLKDILMEFEGLKKRKLEISDVNLQFQNEFLEFLTIKKGYRQTTKHRTIKFLKTVCRHARISGYKTSSQLDSLGVKDGKVNIIYLNPKEIKKIENAKLDSPSLENARIWLLLSCYLGQRGGDLLNCTSSNITTIEGQKMLDIRQEKGDLPLYVLIFPQAQELLEENNGEFPKKISTQNYNLYIKKVCKKAGIDEITFGSKVDSLTKKKTDGYYEKWELVTTHIGRRSLATNYYGKISTPLLMAQTGHKSESMFLKYIGKGRTDQILSLANAIDALV
jgi:integrase